MCFGKCNCFAVNATTIKSQFCERSLVTWHHLGHLRGDGSPLNHITVTVFTLELRRQRLLVLLVLQCHRLGPLELFVHLIRDHPPVQHPADHGDKQETLEDPPLPPGAHPVSHVGPAPLPAVCATKPRLCCWKLPGSTSFFLTSRWRPPLSLSLSLPSLPEHFQAETTT